MEHHANNPQDCQQATDPSSNCPDFPPTGIKAWAWAFVVIVYFTGAEWIILASLFVPIDGAAFGQSVLPLHQRMASGLYHHPLWLAVFLIHGFFVLHLGAGLGLFLGRTWANVTVLTIFFPFWFAISLYFFPRFDDGSQFVIANAGILFCGIIALYAIWRATYESSGIPFNDAKDQHSSSQPNVLDGVAESARQNILARSQRELRYWSSYHFPNVVAAALCLLLIELIALGCFTFLLQFLRLIPDPALAHDWLQRLGPTHPIHLPCLALHVAIWGVFAGMTASLVDRHAYWYAPLIISAITLGTPYLLGSTSHPTSGSLFSIGMWASLIVATLVGIRLGRQCRQGSIETHRDLIAKYSIPTSASDAE